MNTQLKTIDIKGKDYVMVHERIKYFRSEPEYKGWAIETEIIELTDSRVVIKASIKNTEHTIIADGIAYEMANSSFINKTSYIENAGTSAIGRALACLGIGIDASVASAEEVGNAIINQGAPARKNCQQIVNSQEPALPPIYKPYVTNEVIDEWCDNISLAADIKELKKVYMDAMIAVSESSNKQKAQSKIIETKNNRKMVLDDIKPASQIIGGN